MTNVSTGDLAYIVERVKEPELKGRFVVVEHQMYHGDPLNGFTLDVQGNWGVIWCVRACTGLIPYAVRRSMLGVTVGTLWLRAERVAVPDCILRRVAPPGVQDESTTTRDLATHE